TGAVDEASAPIVGNLLGVQAFLTGSINEYQTSATYIPQYNTILYVSAVGMALKLIDSETGQIVWSGSCRGSELGPNLQAAAAQKAIHNIIKKLQKRIVIYKNDQDQQFSSRANESSISLPTTTLSIVQGKIIMVKGRFAAIDIGLQNGLNVGTKLNILRITGGGKNVTELYVGNGFVYEAYKDNSIIKVETTRYKLELGDIVRLP
ncbi:MAG: penicillin-binding protein activator LpoB, partial [candidate division KSB1 bacterium]|nr:penicillin-binding protein activator LpoB [candidate division KSB1 bacterium]